MKVFDVPDHSPKNPRSTEKLDNATNLILIDNYDSFTWNVYQYLVLEGATVTVHRNDQVTIDDLIASHPTQLVISPGPGHPDNDAGVSLEAIKYFSGKIPVLGVCMGEQCIFTAFGGQVNVTGEILHGKTSPLAHDGKGIYRGIPQNVPVTRYHSLAGTHASLPECLEVSSWIAQGPDGGKGIIMGVRHKVLLVEGVQFHPESILTAEGRTMLRTFLSVKGGTWAENESYQQSLTRSLANGIPTPNGGSKNVPKSEAKATILERIYHHRSVAVNAQKQLPSQRPSDLQAAYDLDLSPPLVPFAERVRASPFPLSLLAEVKRASPSKGEIAMNICAPAQARKYAAAGASVISVLTEPEWFKGSIEDLRMVRKSLEGMPNRPAILRKEFFFDEYQILEARLAGADTVLLIVKMLDYTTLEKLYRYSRSLNMEPLVEVNTLEEMQTALKLGARVVGINNRNLSSFEVDLGTTNRLTAGLSKDVFICALSGINGPGDVQSYKECRVGGVLVGEALMRASNVHSFVADLLGGSACESPKQPSKATLVKICGTRTPEAARAAVEAGADMIGIILVEGRRRCVPFEVGQQISKVVRQTKKPGLFECPQLSAASYFGHQSMLVARGDRALLVGVFQNQPLDYILSQQALLDLDIVQLHGSEPLEWASLIPVPVIRRFGPYDAGLCTRAYHALPLVDGATGGTAEGVDSTAIRQCLASDPSLRIVLAGGLTPENVEEKIASLDPYSDQVAAVDVSSGIEELGAQSIEKIVKFVKAAKRP